MSAWFRTGSVNVTAGSKTITINNGTLIGNVEPGFAFVGPDGAVYEIGSVDSATDATLVEDYAGATASGQAYGIIPTKAPVEAFRAALNAVLAAFEGYAEGALAGRFPAGTAGAPSIAGQDDPDTGFSFPGGNQIRGSTGGAQRTLLSSTAYKIDVPITGAAVQATLDDADPEKLMKVGAFGWGASAALGANDFGAMRQTGVYRESGPGVSDKPWSDFDRGHLLHIAGFSEAWSQLAMNRANGDIFTRSANSSGQKTPWHELVSTNNFAYDQGGANDLNDATKQGFHEIVTSAANSPFPGVNGSMIVANRGTGITQIAMRQNSSELDLLSIRIYQGGWSPWRRIFTQSDLVGAVSISGGKPSGAAFERGGNSNGEYVRFADGTQICRGLVDLGSITTFGSGNMSSPYRTAQVNWTYPAAFSDPNVSVSAVARIKDAVVSGTRNAVYASGQFGRYTTYCAAVSATRGSGANEPDEIIMLITAIGRWY